MKLENKTQILCAITSYQVNLKQKDIKPDKLDRKEK